MPMKTYTVAIHDAPNTTRKGHIVTFAREGRPLVDVALHKTSGGYAADHPRSGYAIRPFDQLARFGSPVPLTEAKAKASLLTMLDELKGYERLREACDRYPVLNPDFN